LLTAIETTQGRSALCGFKLLEIVAEIESEQPVSMEGHRLLVSASILNDLLEQSWDLRTNADMIEIRPPHDRSLNGESLNQTKARLREQLLVASNRQLASESVQDFIGYMHREREFNDRIVSVESIIDDGLDLALQLEKTKSSGHWNRILRPYTQVCLPDEYCDFTGLKLLDVWRYFRHTWALEYNPVPGRSMRVLVRNAARSNHPVMGIALLASAPANLSLRDRWIGWSVDEMIQKLIAGELDATSMLGVLTAALDRSLSLLRFDDFIRASEVENPDSTTLSKLSHRKVMATAARNFDLRNQDSDLDEIELIDIRGLPSSKVKNEDWLKLSETSLFKRKRAESLYRLLQARISLRYFGASEAPGAALL
jgi:hypothetical protein